MKTKTKKQVRIKKSRGRWEITRSNPSRSIRNSAYFQKKKKNKGWPTSISTEEIVTGLENGTYKWSHTKGDIPDDIVYKMIVKNEIRLKSCWSISEDSIFATLKNGLIEESSVSSKPGKTKPKLK